MANPTLKVSYDPDTGFFGTEVKGKEHVMTVSEFDRILIVTTDGTFRILSPPTKVLLPDRVVHLGLFDEKKGATFTVVYPDAREDPLRQEDSHPEVHPRPRLQADQGPGRQAGLPHR